MLQYAASHIHIHNWPSVFHNSQIQTAPAPIIKPEINIKKIDAANPILIAMLLFDCVRGAGLYQLDCLLRREASIDMGVISHLRILSQNLLRLSHNT